MLFYAGDDVEVTKLDSCPKCKGRLLLEKDNFGTYKQCLQCGYLRDIETFPGLSVEEMEDSRFRTLHHASPKGSRAIFGDAGQVTEYSRSIALADPLDLQLIPDGLHKRDRD